MKVARRLDALAPARRPWRRGASLLGLAVLGGLAVLAWRAVDLREVRAVLGRADPLLALGACAANLLSLELHARRWAAVVRPQGAPVHRRDAFAALAAGHAVGILLPARAGDVVRAGILGRRAGLSTSALVASTALDYVIGAAALVPLALALAVVMPLPPWAEQAVVLLAAGAAAGLAAAWLLRPRPGGRERPRRGLAGLAARLQDGLAAARAPRALAASMAWSVAGWGAELLIAAFTLGALGLPVTLAAASLAVLSSTAANVVAVSPGNTGPFELAVVIALAGLGVGRAPALAFALLYHLVHLAPVAVVGGGALLAEARRVSPGRDDPARP